MAITDVIESVKSLAQGETSGFNAARYEDKLLRLGPDGLAECRPLVLYCVRWLLSREGMLKRLAGEDGGRSALLLANVVKKALAIEKRTLRLRKEVESALCVAVTLAPLLPKVQLEIFLNLVLNCTEEE